MSLSRIAIARMAGALFLSMAFCLIFPCLARASVPYENYTYTFAGEPIAEPQAYLPSKIVDGPSIGVGEFRNPRDVFVSRSGDIYILDSGNNRIVVTDPDWKAVSVIQKFDNQGQEDHFNNPQGLFVTPDGLIYVADTENSRIVVLDSSGELVRIFSRPESDVLPQDFKPVKIALDSAKRIFIVAKNVNKGMIELDKDGGFTGFFGAVKVAPNIADLFWKQIATEEQKKRMVLTVPTEYSNVSVDDQGFIYGTISALDAAKLLAAVKGSDTIQPVRKLNPMGIDILHRNGYFQPVGDVKAAYVDNTPLTSKLTDVTVGEYGIYSVLDSQRGRIFTYDSEGNLLYIFGGYGDTLGSFGSVEAIDIMDRSSYVVLDGKYNQLVVYQPSDYGLLIRDAVRLESERKYDAASQKWSEAIQYSNSELALVGKGKVLYRQGHFKEAMKYFKLGSNRTLYSKAFKMYRKQLVDEYFGFIMSFLLVLFLVLYGWSKLRKLKAGGGLRWYS